MKGQTTRFGVGDRCCNSYTRKGIIPTQLSINLTYDNVSIDFSYVVDAVADVSPLDLGDLLLLSPMPVVVDHRGPVCLMTEI